MELRHVRYFDAIAETLNFTRAAQRLHVTQSTLSHQIRQMEDELGVALFDRSGRKVRMTEAGEMLRSYMTPALAQIDRGLQALRGTGLAPTAHIRLGTTASFNTRMVPRCVSRFLSQHPGHELTVEERPAADIARGLADGSLDLAVSYQPADDAELWFEPLYNEELRLVVAATHPLARRRRVRMAELHRLRMVLLPRSMATRALLDDCFEAAGAQPTVVAQLNSIAPMIELIRQTDLAGIIAETAVHPAADLRSIPLEDPTPIRTPGLLWKRGATGSPTVRQLATIIRDAVGQAG
ncbi:LysR substrate-binding domain-containing protein [Ramlibacter sp. AN1015]|uniref:LysR substrate-binding domain-containing protein n=1 Tax=Ramlibacter sp. AN1015 TaxID=3133428 RepID=UPI0030C4972A